MQLQWNTNRNLHTPNSAIQLCNLELLKQKFQQHGAWRGPSATSYQMTDKRRHKNILDKDTNDTHVNNNISRLHVWDQIYSVTT